jgi:hypothetical protein
VTKTQICKYSHSFYPDMTKNLKTLDPLIKLTMGELEETAQRLAEEFNIPLSETNASGISYEKELEGQNDQATLTYFKDVHSEYERIEINRQGNQFGIVHLDAADCKDRYSVILKAYGQNLLNALKKKPHKKGVETQLLAGIANQLITLKKQPEKQHEICANIDEAELKNISRKTIEKYLS